MSEDKKEIKTTDLDFHLNVESTKDGSMVLASWSMLLKNASFSIQIEAVTKNKVNETVGLMSDFQKRILSDFQQWDSSIEPPPAA